MSLADGTAWEKEFGIQKTIESSKEDNLEKAIKEIIELVELHDEELAYDCRRILDRDSWT